MVAVEKSSKKSSLQKICAIKTATMCKHILNAQVSIRTSCCRQWFDCPECHAEVADHPLSRTTEMIFACKKCKKVFRKELENYEEQDEFCPHCDNQYIIEAHEPQMEVGFETEDVRKDSSLIRDDRVKQKQIDPYEALEEYRKIMAKQMAMMEEAEEAELFGEGTK
ncbi:hypothetical protein BC828DRAFT_392744 [Blastocladiella britannica]|nr:hypothetical protein BC828DRAFT_392744 [Blastocladiella britannica]